jgi:integrase
MSLPKSDSIEVCEGVYIRRTGQKGKFQCYFRLLDQKKNFRYSTKTSDEISARKKALEFYQNAHSRTEEGKTIEKISFQKLVKAYLKTLKHDPQDYKKRTIAGKFLPYFSDVDDVSQLKNKDIFEYIIHCQETREISPVTLNRENSVLRQLIKFGINKEWVPHNIKVDTVKDRHAKNRKPHFTKEEYKTLYQTSRNRVYEAKNSGDIKLYWTRYLLHNYILFMANTGLRVGEAKTLTWRDIDFEEGVLKLREAGKVRSSRMVCIDGYGTKALKRLYKLREEFLAKLKKPVPKHEHIFLLPDGTKVGSQRKAFETLLKACGFVYLTAKDRHCFLSLRHTYATNKLIIDKIPTRALAKQMGTSERMINMNYGHDEVENYRNLLQKFDVDGKRIK